MASTVKIASLVYERKISNGEAARRVDFVAWGKRFLNLVPSIPHPLGNNDQSLSFVSLSRSANAPIQSF